MCLYEFVTGKNQYKKYTYIGMKKNALDDLRVDKEITHTRWIILYIFRASARQRKK